MTDSADLPSSEAVAPQGGVASGRSSQPSPAASKPPIVDTLSHQVRPLVLAAPLLILLTGVLFPLLLAGLARPLFPRQADGSLLEREGVIVGSELIGQGFADPGYFHPRGSAAGKGYDGLASGGSNLSPTNPKLQDDVSHHAEEYRLQNGLPADAVLPVDAVTRSGSGLDPHISPANAELQVPRVARQRRLSEEQVRGLVAQHTRGRQLGVLGEPCVEVLPLNLALDRLTPLPIPPGGR